MISAEQLRNEERRLRYLTLIERPDVFPTLANWQFITSNALQGLGHHLYKKYLTSITIDDNDREELHDIAVKEFPAYLAAIDRREAVDVVYGDVTTAPEHTIRLIRDNRLFDASSISRLISAGNLDFAMSVIDVYQPEYSFADLEAMENLGSQIDSLPLRGIIEERQGFFGSSEKYICPDGHINPADNVYCRGCGKNARGLTETQEKAIAQFKGRLQALKSLLSNIQITHEITAINTEG